MAISDTIEPDWTEVQIPSLTRGLNFSLSAEGLQPDELTVAQNVNILGNILVGETGFYPYHSIETAMSANNPEGDTVMALDDAVQYFIPDNGHVLIQLDDGTYHRAEVTSWATASIMYYSPALPSDATLGNAVIFAPKILGTCMLIHQLEQNGLVTDSFLITTRTVYKDSANEWIPVIDDNAGSPVSTTIASTAAVVGDTSIEVASVAGFTAGDVVVIELDTNSFWGFFVTTIATVSSPNITLDDPIPFAAAIGNTVELGVTLNGGQADDHNATEGENGEQNRVRAVSIPWDDKFVFTNGSDNVKFYDDTTGRIDDLNNLSGIAGLPANTKSRDVTLFNNVLVLLNTEENSTKFAQRVRYCDTADLTAWNAGVAGTTDLLDRANSIISSEKLGPYLYIYRKRGVVRMGVSGETNRTFDFDEIMSQHGVSTVQGVAENRENIHFLFDIRNFYEYGGGFSVAPTGDRIKDRIFTRQGDLNFDLFSMASILHLEPEDSILSVYVSGSDGIPKKAYKYNYRYQAWTERMFNASVWGYGDVVSGDSSLSWNDLVGPWTAQNFPWSSASVIGGESTKLLLYDVAPNSGAFIYNGLHSTDFGTAISVDVQTKNFLEIGKVRFDWIDIFCAGGQITVSISKDRGQTWETYGTISAILQPANHRLYKQLITDQYMMRFETSDPGFQLHSVKIRVTPEQEIR